MKNLSPPHNLILLTKNVINEPVYVCVCTETVYRLITIGFGCFMVFFISLLLLGFFFLSFPFSASFCVRLGVPRALERIFEMAELMWSMIYLYPFHQHRRCAVRDDALVHWNKGCNREDRLLIGAGSWFLCC